MTPKILKQLMFASRYACYIFIVHCLGLQFLMAHNLQGQKLEEVNVSLNFHDARITAVFEAIEQQSDFTFSYNHHVQQDQSVLDVIFSGNLRAFLQMLSHKTTYNFERIGQEIYVVERDDKAPAQLRESFTERIVTGEVSDTGTGVPLVGATIRVPGTSLGTLTDADGKFSLHVPDTVTALIISYIGYVTQQVSIDNKKHLVITLQADIHALDEVTVIGYGAVSAHELTTSVARIDVKAMKDQNITSFEQGLVGLAPGMQINQTTGAPGGNISIKIRGAGSLSGNEPLYVVDGIPLDNDGLRGATSTNYDLEQPTNPLSTLNPADIESISVLKDAAATAIYGSRGSNGVVIITTKRGSTDKPQYQFSTYYGVQSVTKKVKVLDAYQYAELSRDGQNASYLYNNPDASADDPNVVRGSSSYEIAPELYPYLNGINGLTNTDWQDEIFRNGIMKNYNLAISGKSGKSAYYVSGNYLDQQGIVIESQFKRYTARLKYDFRNDKMAVGANLSPAYTDSDLLPTEGAYWQEGIISTAQTYAPIFPVYNQDGTLNYGNNNWGYGHTDQLNPVAIAKLTDDRKQQFRILGNIFVEYNILKNLTYKMQTSGDINIYKRDYYRSSLLEERSLEGNSEAYGSSRSTFVTNYLIDHTLTYTPSLEHHHLTFLAGYSFQKNRTERNYLKGTGYPNDLVQTLNSASVIESGYSNGSEWSLISYFGRAQYDFDERYLLSASVRTDGSSRFAPGNKWGIFPSVSAGWLASEESFIKNIPQIQLLKLRASYGISGNFNIGNYEYISLLTSENYVFGEGDGEISTGLTQSSLGNENLGWESQRTTDFGLDAALFNDQLTLQVDYYQSINEDFLFDVPVPAASGFSSVTENKGKIQNNGIELMLGTHQDIGALAVDFSVNYSRNRNKVEALDGQSERIIYASEGSNVTGDNGANFLVQTGKPLGGYYLYKTDGVFLNQEDVDNNASYADARPGDVKYVDVNGDGEITADDRTVVGNFYPDYIFGASLKLAYKGFDAALVLSGSQGNEILNLHRRYTYNITGNFNNLIGAVNRWRSEEDPGDGKTVRAKTSTGNQSNISSRHVEDGSYVKLHTISIGYTLPASFLDRFGITQARFYANVQNAFIWSHYSGYNPEVSDRPNDPTTGGEDYGSYPLARTTSVGLNLTF